MSPIAMGLLVLFLAVGFLCIGLGIVVEIPLVLVLGWIYFLLVTLPSVQPDWSAIGLAMIALALLIAGIHRTGRRWASRQTTTADGSSHDVATIGHSCMVWKARWTASLVVALLLIFTAGISVVAIVHQSVWMVTGEERLVDSNRFEFSGRSQSKNHLKNIGLGIHNYSDANGSLPAGGTFDADGHPLHSAMTMILPFVEQQTLFTTIDLTHPWNAAQNRRAFETFIPIYQLPIGVPNPKLESRQGNDSDFALSNYAGNIHVLPLGHAMQISDIRDGTSNTILFGEVNQGLRPWGDPLNVRDPANGINQGPKSYGSPFSKGANILLADGSVRFVLETISPDVLKALSTPNSGEFIPEF